MSDLIDREAVREFIKSYRHSTDVAFHMEEHLDEIPTVNPWHRVEEKPAKEEECLTVSVDGHIEVNWWSNSWGWLHDADNIEWWMPLPEPPKEVQE